MTARKTTETFISEASATHNNKYDYSQVVYINTTTKVCIICPVHGVFYQTPGGHTHKRMGCAKCGTIKSTHSKRVTTQQFVHNASIVHNNKYDYTLSVYKTAKSKVIIICPDHGEFAQTPDNHVNNKQGCRACQYKNRTLSTEEFIRSCAVVHNNKYNYSKVQYLGSQQKVEIVCPTHGSFWQTPDSHKNTKTGCPKCTHSRYVGVYSSNYFIKYPDRATQPASLYLISLNYETEYFYKIGISAQLQTNKRFVNMDPYVVTVIKLYDMPLISAFQLEQQMLLLFSQFSYTPIYNFKGHTECLLLSDGAVLELTTQLDSY